MTSRTLNRVLLTGAAGRIGRVMRERLAGKFPVLRVSDIVDLGPARAGEEVETCDLTDAAGMERLCAGVDAVAHFGGCPGEEGWDQLIPANIVGLINLFEAARKQGVDRVLFASSNHAIGLYRRTETLTSASPPRPDGRYGVTKAFGEDLGYAYACKYGVRSFNMRIGTFGATPTDARSLATWLSHGDMERLVMTGLTADYRHAIVYGCSRNTRSWWDNSHAYALGYDPRDDAEAWAGEVTPPAAAPDSATELLQGGGMAGKEFIGDPRLLP
jgi:uronate dehydrogenase